MCQVILNGFPANSVVFVVPVMKCIYSTKHENFKELILCKIYFINYLKLFIDLWYLVLLIFLLLKTMLTSNVIVFMIVILLMIF